MKILFFGTPQFAVPSLDILKTIDFLEMIGVVTHPDRPKGRHLVITPPPVKLEAERYRLPVYQPKRVTSDIFKGMDLDLIIVVSFGQILSRDILELPRIGCINLHASLLPKYRGAGPVAWALMNGETCTGVTTFWINEEMDSGDIILQEEVEIMPEDNRGTLEERLSHIGAQLLKETIIRIKEGTAPRIPQDNSKATYAPKIRKEDGLIDWSKDASQIHNKVRAMNPWPGAYTFLKGIRIEIWESKVIQQQVEQKPGTIVLLNDSGIGVGTGNGVLLIKELQAEGRKRLKAIDFINGYRLNEGERFGI